MSWVIRDYQAADLQGCLAVIDSNTPGFFAAHEPAEFLDDLAKRESLSDAERWPYFVLETSGIIRGCGGYYIDKSGVAVLIWGMVLREEHRCGLGSALLNYRILHMKDKVESITIDTTPESFGFYKKAGFVQTGIEQDGYEPSLDKVLATLKFNTD